jgi:hypothetical protein
MRSFIKIVLSALAFGMFLPLANAAPPLSGAIFTTDYIGNIVNGNTKYESKCGVTGVWLDGGPGPNAPATAAGLPDGDYYFQVTDPSGKKLLSTDPVQDRCVTVSGGVIVDNSCSVNPHNTNPSVDAGGGIVVELCPYDDTPNNGGVYKAWITPVGDGTVAGGGFVGDPAQVDNSCGNGCFHGFLPARSKTDNFKVRDVDLFCIKARKTVLDDKGDSMPGVGWEIVVTDGLGVSNSIFTGADGMAQICGLVSGFYTVAETQQAGFTIIDTRVEGVAIDPPSESVIVQLKKGQVKNDDTILVEFTNEECAPGGCPK